MKQLFLGDCIEVLKTLPENSVDSLVTDPPAGISFMNKDWDDDKGGREQWIEWMTEVMRECLRVMKPGAHGLIWSIPRTSHWTGTALERAGFEVRDIVSHIFGQGFPKSLNISKAIDKSAGAERKIVGKKHCGLHHRGGANSFTDDGWKAENREGDFVNVTAPATDAAKQWDGWGTALKPSVEMWWLVRKPCSEKTVAKNVLAHGCGGINIDACRIGTELRVNPPFGIKGWREKEGRTDRYEAKETSVTSRFPANLVFSHSPYCTDDQCDIECAVKMLDEQSLAGGMHSAGSVRTKKLEFDREKSIFGIGHKGGHSPRIGDSGGASRFFYCAKVSSSERNAGLEEMPDVEGGIKNSGRGGFQKQGLYVGGKLNSNHEAYGLGNFNNNGRFPANLVFSHNSECEETCSDECAVKMLDDQAGICKTGNIKPHVNAGSTFNTAKNITSTFIADNGANASRFFYCAKVSPKERNAGLEEMPDREGGIKNSSGRGFSESNPMKLIITKNHHPTVKPQKLMRYLCKLITPPNGVVLDPFMGSGSTGMAALAEAFQFIGIEKEQEYFEIAEKRIQ